MKIGGSMTSCGEMIDSDGLWTGVPSTNYITQAYADDVLDVTNSRDEPCAHFSVNGSIVPNATTILCGLETA